MESAELAVRARRAYERGRLRWAARVAVYVVPLALLSTLTAGNAAVSLGAGAALLGLATAARWRGRAAAAAVPAGLAAGLIPFALMMLLKVGSGRFCALGACMEHCLRFCAAGGLAAGLLLATQARQRSDGVAEFLVVGGLVAALTGLLECFVGGMAGAAWMALGELAGTAPLFAWQLRRR